MFAVAGILNVLLIWTIVAIPNIMAHFRMVPVAFMPFGRKVISKELAKIIMNPETTAEEKEAVEQYGSSDSGASLGDILGAALKGDEE